MQQAQPVASTALRLGACGQSVQCFLELVGVRTLCLGKCFKPIGDFVKAFVAGGFCHARVHVGVLVGLASHCGGQVVTGAAKMHAGSGVAALLQPLEVAVGVAGLTFGGGAEHGRNVVVALDVGLVREVQITTVSLAFASKRVLQILVGFGTVKTCHLNLQSKVT